MRWNQAGLRNNFLALLVILSTFLLIPTTVEAGICYNPNIPEEGCTDNVTAGSCPSSQIFSIEYTCADVQAASDLIEEATKTPAEKDSKKQGLSALKESVETLTKSGKATKPLEEVIGGYVKTALILVGVLFTALTFYGGYIWFIARDDEEEAKRAKSIISMALIGLIIVLGAYAVTYFIIYRLTVASGTGL